MKNKEDLLAQEDCGACQCHASTKDNQSGQHDESIFHPISLFFDKVEAYRGRCIRYRVNREDQSNLRHSQVVRAQDQCKDWLFVGEAH